MPSGLRKTTGNHFEIYYEEPWGGVASDKSPVDIDAGDLVVCEGITVRNGILCFTDITANNSLYNLNTLNPPNIPAYSDTANGGTQEIAITSILPADYDYRTHIYNGRLYTVASTADLSVGSVIGITGTTNSVDDYDFNGSDVVDVIIDSTHFHTATPYLSAYNYATYPTPTVTGGEISVFVANNTGSGFSFIPVQGGGFVGIGIGTAPYNTAITLPAGFTVANSVCWTAPGSTPVPSGNPLISGVYESIYTAGVVTASFNLAGTNTPNLQPPSNYVCVCWNAPGVTITTAGLVTYISFTTVNGDPICLAYGANVLNTAVITAPTGFTYANSINIVGAASSDGANHTFQAMGQCSIDSGGEVHLQYRDNQSNFWYGGANVLVLFYVTSATVSTTTVLNGTGVIIDTSNGLQLCYIAGTMQHGQTTSIPTGFSLSTLEATCSQYGDYNVHGDAEAICWSKCEMDGLVANCVINSYNDSWNEGVAFFGFAGTVFTPTPPPPPAGGWVASAYLALIFNVGKFLCGVDQFGFSYIATQKTDGTVAWNYDQVAANGPTLSFGVPTAVKVIDGVAYISVYDTNTLYAYIPQTSYVIATQYASGKYIEIFDEYLLQLNTNSQAKDSSDGEQPTRINWSSPDEFSVWDPSVNRTAGYQSITSAEDYITGFVAVDNVGYIFRRTGITQITATGVAIQPFNFTTYWNSTIGQGLLFPGTLKQYGRFTFLTTDSAVYMFYGGSFTAISEKAAAAIFSQLEGQSTINSNTNTNIAGGISIFPLNDNIPNLYYILITTFDNTNPNIVFWFYNTNTKCWTSVPKNILDMISAYTGLEVSSVVINFIRTSNVFLDYVVSPYYSNTPNYAVNLILINATYVVTSDGTPIGNYTQSFVFYDIVSTPTSDDTYLPSPAGSINLLFRQEEIKLGRQPTVRRVVVKASGSGTLALTLSGVDFGTIILNGSQTPATYKSNYGIYTGEDPQLNIQSTNFNGQIVKVMLAGTYADGDID